MIITENGRPTTITPSNTAPAVNQPFTISGTLKAGGTPLPGKSVTLGRLDPSGTGLVGTTATGQLRLRLRPE